MTDHELRMIRRPLRMLTLVALAIGIGVPVWMVALVIERVQNLITTIVIAVLFAYVIFPAVRQLSARKAFSLLIFAVTTLLGAICAQGVAGTATALSFEPSQTSQAQLVTPSPSAPVGSPSPAPSAVPAAWAAFEHAWTDITAYSATVTLFEQKDTQTQNSVFDYTFHKPASATVHYNQGANAGVTVVWDGGDTVIAHRGSGLSALFKKKFGLHDPTVTTIRGSSIDQLSFAAILAHAQDTPGPTSQAVGPVIDGVPTNAVTLIPNSSVSNTGLTREVVDISTATNLPARILGYDGDTLVRRVDFSNVKTER